jgi:hypothetical protein
MDTVKITVTSPDPKRHYSQRYYIRAVNVKGVKPNELMCDSKSRLEYTLSYCMMNNWAVVGFEDE